MEYYVKSVISIIESNYHKLTSAEKTVADFFIHNNQNTDFSSSHIAELLYTSKATLSRFAKKIGYRGYQEFIYQYENTFEEKEEKITGNTKIVLNAYQEVLNKTYNLVDEAQIGRIVGYLNKADRVLVCGCGSSGLSAKEMEIRFMRIGIDVDSMTDSDMIKMASVFQNRRSLIFGFSISGEREEVTYLLREAYNKGAKTVLFTTNNGKKFSEYYSEVVALSSLKKTRSCSSCKYKNKCTSSKSGRTLQRWEHEAVLEAVHEKTWSRNETYKQRRCIVEHPFGTVKRSLGYSFFLRKRIENVDAEASSMFIAYNLKRLFAVFSTQELIAKFR